MSQKQKILELLKAGGWVDTGQFLSLYISRGSDCIFRLRKEGINIESERVPGKTIFRYRLRKPLIKMVPEFAKECIKEAEAPPRLFKLPQRDRDYY